MAVIIRAAVVPAGHEFVEWQQPRVRSRVICLYFDPDKLPVRRDARFRTPRLEPRVFFEHNVLWETAVKLAKAVEDGSEDQRYSEALGIIIAHELLSIHGNGTGRGSARGGLAVWPQRIATAYVDEHLAETIPLAELAKLVDLSSHYFCRAFKQSLGVPPHRYQINRRVERAKQLLADRVMSVTDIGLALGFSETSSFSATFRCATGASPTEYRRAFDQAAYIGGMPASERSVMPAEPDWAAFTRRSNAPESVIPRKEARDRPVASPSSPPVRHSHQRFEPDEHLSLRARADQESLTIGSAGPPLRDQGMRRIRHAYAGPKRSGGPTLTSVRLRDAQVNDLIGGARRDGGRRYANPIGIPGG